MEKSGPMSQVLWPAGAALLASFAALIGSGAIVLLGRKAERAAVWLLSFAIGTLSGAATLHLIPEALAMRPVREVMLALLGGIVLFIVAERAIRWRHSHAGEEHHPHAVTAEVLLWGDALHNFVDGIILGIAFASGRDLGLIASLAVFAHEIPQEIGDFAVLLESGMPRRRAILLNYLSALTVLPGTIAAFLWSSSLKGAAGWLLPLAAGGFLYIALADLVPSLHHSRGRWAAVGQIALILAGIGVILLAGETAHH